MFFGVLCASVRPSCQKQLLCLCSAYPGLCSSEGVEELQETNRMSVGGQMREGKSDEEVCVCVCVLIPGRASSESELLGSSVGVPDVDTRKSRGRE